MNINITLLDIARLCLYAWFMVAMFLAFAPSLSRKFKERFAGTAYVILNMAVGLALPLMVAVCLKLTGNIPLKERARTVFTIDREGIHYVWKK